MKMVSQKEKLAKFAAMYKPVDRNNDNRPSNYYRFWKMDFDQTATVRILPDKDEDNYLEFNIEKFMHNLEINGEFKTVPCLKMYGEKSCPICDVSSAFYKEEGDKSVRGKQYYRKKQHIVQALILEDPLPPNTETGENSEGKVCYLNIGYQLFSVVEEALTSGDLDAVPWDINEGYDFIIKKTKSPDGNAKYDLGSKFVRRASSLSEDQIAIVEEGSINLNTLIPQKPTLERVEGMLNAALTGEPWDDGYNNSGGNSAKAATEPTQVAGATTTEVVEAAVEATAASEPAATKATAVADPASEATDKNKAAGKDVLKMILDRKKPAAEG